MNRRARSQLPLLILFIGFAVAMCVCVVGLMLWKAAEERRMTIERAEINTQNLANSLARHAGSAFQAADVAIGGIAELMRFQTPVPERINPYLTQRIQALPQIREIVVLGPDGRWLFSSLPELATYSNEDRDYFQYHKASSDTAVRISSLRARLSGRPTILLTKRISRQDGSFAGVVLATIDTDYFRKFYESFRLGHDGSISLLHGDGRVLARWPGEWTELDLSQTELFTTRLSASPAGFYRVRSMFDGVEKYFAYRQESQYPIIATVARAEAEVLAQWREGVRQDLIVAIAMLAAIVLLAALITHQFSLRARMVAELRERESRYRLLADNIADIVVMFDTNGDILYTSPAVTRTMGFLPDELVGTSCFDLVRHEDDVRAIKKASREATADNARTVEFCAVRKDKTDVWLEANFRRADRGGDLRMVAVLRDISVRRRMEDELQKLTDKLARLATTDALSGLANRRAFDDFLEEQFARHERTAMLLIDIDNFKAFNDTLGHQAGDRCIGAVAHVIADVTRDTGALGARYGGEEFAVVLPALGEAEAATVATAIRLGVRALGIAHPGASRGFVSISVGIACKQRVESSGRALVADADLALYQAKELGRNCVVAASSLRRAAADETADSTAS